MTSSEKIHGSRPNRLKRAVPKVLHEPAYILHSQPYRDTSLLLDVFTRHYGRVSVLAKGARRPYTQWRASSFQTFQTLSMSFTHKSEVKTLLDAEWVGGIPMLQGAALISGYYMNEWLRRGLARDDVHEGLFDAYQHSLADLSLSPLAEHAAVLRAFELKFLTELGFAVPLQGEFEPTQCYSIGGAPQVLGQTLIDMQNQHFHAPQTAQEAKMLLRYWLQQHVGDKPLYTRNLLLDLQGLG
ncbi:MAG: DNA repair protein RecO [Formosimonas sp.]